MTDEHDPDLTGQDWPHPPDVLPGDPYRVRESQHMDEDAPAERWTASPPPSDGYERLRSDALDRIADGVDLPRELVADIAAEGNHRANPDSYEQLIVRERAAQARHRARTRQLQDIQNTALTILIPLIGFISAVLLAGIARLVWLL